MRFRKFLIAFFLIVAIAFPQRWAGLKNYIQKISFSVINTDSTVVDYASLKKVLVDSIAVKDSTVIFIGNNITGSGTYDPTVSIATAGGDRGINLSMSQITTPLTGTLTGAKFNSRVNVESPSGSVTGIDAQAGNQSAGYSLSVARAGYFGLTNKVPVGPVTWTYARGVEVNMDLDQGTSGNTNTVTNAAMFYGVYNLPTVATYATVTNGYGIFVRNEAVGGTGQMLDAAFYADDLNHSGGIVGWDYGLDFSGVAGFGTADVITSTGAMIFSGTATTGDLIYAEVGAYDATGSLYITTNGALYVQVANAGAATDWYKVTTTDAD